MVLGSCQIGKVVGTPPSSSPQSPRALAVPLIYSTSQYGSCSNILNDQNGSLSYMSKFPGDQNGSCSNISRLSGRQNGLFSNISRFSGDQKLWFSNISRIAGFQSEQISKIPWLGLPRRVLTQIFAHVILKESLPIHPTT